MYLVCRASVGLGLTVHWFVVPLRVTVAVTADPLVLVPVLRATVAVPTPLTASLKVTVMLLVRLTLVALLLGLREVTVGAVVSAGGAAVPRW